MGSVFYRISKVNKAHGRVLTKHQMIAEIQQNPCVDQRRSDAMYKTIRKTHFGVDHHTLAYHTLAHSSHNIAFWRVTPYEFVADHHTLASVTRLCGDQIDFKPCTSKTNCKSSHSN